MSADRDAKSDRTGVAPAPVVSTRCRVEWIDTDGAGHYHHGTVVRWVEVAEAEFFRSLGAQDLYGRIPRVHYEVDYISPAWFGDVVDIELFVTHIGRSSLAMSFVAKTASATVARGRHTIVHLEETSRRSAAWPVELRSQIELAIDEKVAKS